MPIRKYLGDSRSFAPDDLDAMGRAFTAALAKLGLNDRSDAMVEMVGRRIVRAALCGERNVTALSEIGAGAGSESGDAGVIVIAQTDRNKSG